MKLYVGKNLDDCLNQAAKEKAVEVDRHYIP